MLEVTSSLPSPSTDGERGLLLHRQVRVALVEEDVLEDVVGRRQRLVHVAELVGLVAVDVALLAVLVDAGFRVVQGFFRIGNGFQLSCI